MKLTSITGTGLALLCILFFQACKPGNHIQYGAVSCYQLAEGEKQVDITQEEKALFAEYCTIGDLELPINRAFRGTQSSFISMGFTMSMPDVYDAMARDSTLRVLEHAEFDNGDVLYRKHLVQKGKGWLTKVVFIEPKFDHVMIYDVIFDSEAAARAFYSQNSNIVNKLTCEK